MQRLDALPLWLIEGMAEYFSLGREDPLTAMWLRDAALRDKLPTIEQLTPDPRFFPYRYGQALWAYVGGRWGDRAVTELYRFATRAGWDPALQRVFGISSESLSEGLDRVQSDDVPAADRRAPASRGCGRPSSCRLMELGAMNLSPTVSPDGKLRRVLQRAKPVRDRSVRGRCGDRERR